MTSWEKHHASMQWCDYAIIMLGIWLLVTLATFGTHSLPMAWSDGLTGVALMILGYLSLSGKRLWAPWLACLAGVWLQLAPLVFWAPTAFDYLNDTLIGILVICFSLLIPGTPGLIEGSGQTIPNHWSYNPSSWAQRLPIIFLASICWFCARYMAAYQLGYIDQIWDPLFHNGTLNVITSKISRGFPISDAGLGAAAYTIEALMGCKGGERRWCTMPWTVTLFGFLVIPVGIVSIILIMLQPLAVGSWCFWCLLTALCMLIMVALTVDEVAAMLQFLKIGLKQGVPFSKIFWQGETALGSSSTFVAPPPSLTSETSSFWFRALQGVSVPWNLVLTALLGVWLMFMKDEHPFIDDLNHIYGALIVTFSVISIGEVARPLRWLNVLLGLATSVTGLFMDSFSLFFWEQLVVGVVVALLSIRRGRLYQHYGKLDSYLL